MISATLVVGLPASHLPAGFDKFDKLSAYYCVDERDIDPWAIVYGIEIVEACETWAALKGISVMCKISDAKKEFKEIVGKEGAIILTPDVRDY